MNRKSDYGESSILWSGFVLAFNGSLPSGEIYEHLNFLAFMSDGP
jgi:hypothetical protein